MGGFWVLSGLRGREGAAKLRVEIGLGFCPSAPEFRKIIMAMQSVWRRAVSSRVLAGPVLAGLISAGLVAGLGLGAAEAREHGLRHAQAQKARHAIVVAAEPDAAAAGLSILRAGGSAVDAAVAVQAVLSLEEPQSSGLGGGAFMVFYNAKTHKLSVYNGREKAPASADSHLFYGPDGKPMSYIDAIMSGRSTGVPGAVAMLAKAQSDHGRLPWSRLFDPAHRLAEDGFHVPARMAAAMASHYPQTQTPDAIAYFHKPDGTLYGKGEVMTNLAYAKTLEVLANQGASALYSGPLAEAIIARTQVGPVPGGLTLADFAAYQPEMSEALCTPYRQYQVCSTPAPGGGVGLLELLNILAHTDIATRGPKDPEAWRIFAQASRLMYADRDFYEGDPDQVTVPVAGLLEPAYGAERAKLINSFTTAAPAHGAPKGSVERSLDATREPGGTTHFVIVDAEGNMVSMTTTVESIFGSGRMANGYFLNNQLTDFSAAVDETGAPAANAPGPAKRPRSSMTPVIVLDAHGVPVAAIGSPGGNSIIAYVAKALVGWIDWKMPLQQAVNLPNIVARGGGVSVEAGAAPEVVAHLRQAGLPVSADAGERSGLNGIVLHARGFETATDPRREGEARSY